jgi:hypothetical protein
MPFRACFFDDSYRRHCLLLGLNVHITGRQNSTFYFDFLIFFLTMNSPFANLFLALQEQATAHVPEIVHIDQELGQLNSKNRPPVSWPCLLIDFEDFRFKNLSENVQTAKGIIVLRLGFAQFSASSASVPAGYKEKAIGYYDIEWKLHKALQGWAPPGNEFGSLCRTSAVTQERADGYRVRELRYKIAFDDYSTKLEQLYAPATLVVDDVMALL